MGRILGSLIPNSTDNAAVAMPPRVPFVVGVMYPFSLAR
jgi:hypothetical protein